MDVLAFVNLALFIPAAIALIVTPGPVVLYMVTRSVDQGRRLSALETDSERQLS
jgi:threonine/homoserine/homoserine lactone efflux protein